MSKDRRLGRGLAALLGTPATESDPTTGQSAEGATPNFGALEIDQEPAIGDMVHLNVYEIDDNPFQPRREFSEPEIASLSESLREHDMLQPVLVRRIGERYQLISGERRLRAAIRAGWSTVPARIRKADDRLVAELAIVENLQRKDLNPIEKAMSFRRYLDEHDCKQEDLAHRLKIDRSTIANLMRLLELPGPVLAAVRDGKLSAGHGRALLPLGEEEEQIAVGQRIQEDGLSVRDTERLVQEKLAADEPPSVAGYVGQPESNHKKKSAPSDQLAALEQELRVALGSKVEIRQTSRGRGRIVVHFANHDEFERIRECLAGGDATERRVA